MQLIAELTRQMNRRVFLMHFSNALGCDFAVVWVRSSIIGRVHDTVRTVSNSIDVFWLVLDEPEGTVRELFDVLSVEEQRKVSLLHDPLKRSRSIVRLARRRRLLAQFLQVDSRDLNVLTASNGKPFVNTSSGESVEFSSSHSNHLGVVAISIGQPLGIDVESLSDLPDSTDFTSSITHGSEFNEIRELPLLSQSRALLRIWTQKEAYLKATGEGLRVSLQDFAVPIDSEPIGQTFDPLSSGKWWYFFGLECPQPEFDAALVVAAKGPDKPAPNLT